MRFISVNDHYDSDTKEGTAGDWDVVFKNFLYDLYSKDLSKKTTAAKRSKARKGEYLGKAPIGYVRSKERKNQLEIEPEGAKIVRFIFDMALSGHTIPEIVKMLNQSGIPTPGTLTEKNNKGKQMMVRKNTTVICWQYNMVWGIFKEQGIYRSVCQFQTEQDSTMRYPHKKE
nr:recombinase family protein [Ruminococcus sp. AF46-10NS]